METNKGAKMHTIQFAPFIIILVLSLGVLSLFADEPMGNVSHSSDEYVVKVEKYSPPDVMLIDQNRKDLNFQKVIEDSDAVVLNFLFTSCPAICPIQAAIISRVQQSLKGKHNVHFITVSIDPENDTPERMNQYLKKFNASEGWDFLTGDRKDIESVLKAFDAYVPDKMSHTALALMRTTKTGPWSRVTNFTSSDQLTKAFEKASQK